MHKFVAVLAVAALAACSDPTTESTPAAAVEAVPASVPPQTQQPEITANGLVRNVAVDGVPYQAEVASLQGDTLVSTGNPGFLMYGPYAPLAAGKYRLTVQGEVGAMTEGAQLLIDVASQAGATSHGETVVSTPMAGQDSIADIEFTLQNAVPDLEVRAQVTEGAQVKIRSYQIVAAE